jgi:tetratricopeptide (TPR) repeat protein
VKESGGNPLFALELARAQSTGSLTQVIASRLAQLDGRARDLVSWAAAIGHQFDAETLGRATEMPSGEMLTALEKLERLAIIRVAESRFYDFAHDLVRDVAYQTISGPRRLLVHRQIARALQSMHDPDSVFAGDIVRHASLAGDNALAVPAAVAAGQRCLRMFAYADATNVARLALQLADTLPPTERFERQTQLFEIIVTARTPIAERLKFSPRIAELIDAARNNGQARSAALGAHLLAALHADAGDLVGAEQQTIRSAEIARSADPRAAAYAMANTARCLLFIERDIPRAQSLLAEVEAIIGAVGGDHIEIALGLGYLHAHRGEYESAVAHLGRALEMAAREQDHWREWCAAARLVTLALETRNLDAAKRWCERLQPVAAKMTGGSEGVRTELLASIARFALDGKPRDLRARLQDVREIDSKSDLAWALTFIAELELERGETETARRDAEEALAAADTVGRPSEAALARVILSTLTGKRLITKADPNLSERAIRCFTEWKETRHGQHGRRANV